MPRIFGRTTLEIQFMAYLRTRKAANLGPSISHFGATELPYPRGASVWNGQQSLLFYRAYFFQYVGRHGARPKQRAGKNA
jgi:hypothetical protein